VKTDFNKYFAIVGILNFYRRLVRCATIVDLTATILCLDTGNHNLTHNFNYSTINVVKIITTIKTEINASIQSKVTR